MGFLCVHFLNITRPIMVNWFGAYEFDKYTYYDLCTIVIHSYYQRVLNSVCVCVFGNRLLISRRIYERPQQAVVHHDMLILQIIPMSSFFSWEIQLPLALSRLCDYMEIATHIRITYPSPGLCMANSEQRKNRFWNECRILFIIPILGATQLLEVIRLNGYVKSNKPMSQPYSSI